MKSITFCMHSYNRDEILQKTLEYNCHQLSKCEKLNGEVVLVRHGDFKTHLISFLTRLKHKYPFLSVHRYSNDHGYHASVSKNYSHFVANGEVLLNLDVDNFINEKEIMLIQDAFGEFPDGCIFQLWNGVKRNGGFGKICYRRDQFLEIGGYDESFFPAGYQDVDLIERLKAQFKIPLLSTEWIEKKINLSREEFPFPKPIQNSYKEKTENVRCELNWAEMEKENRLMSKRRMKQKVYCRNLNYKICDRAKSEKVL